MSAVVYRACRFRDARPGVSPQVLADAEKQMNLILPQDFRDMYRIVDGGVPEKHIVLTTDNDEYIFQKLFPLGVPGQGVSIVGSYIKLHKELELIPSHLFPFASNGTGDYWCADARSGTVLLVPMDTSYHFDEAVVSVASSLGEFFSFLYTQEEYEAQWE